MKQRKDYGQSWITITFCTVISLTGVIYTGNGFARDRNLSIFNKSNHTQSEQASETKMQDSTAFLLSKIEDLQRQVQQLRGDIEMQNHEITRLQQQQANFVAFQQEYEDQLKNDQNSTVSRKQDQMNHAVPAQKNMQAQSDQKNHNPQYKPLNLDVSKSLLASSVDEKTSYDEAYDLVQRRQFKQAISAMQQHLNTFPNGIYTSNAIYWLGELYLAEGSPQQALDQFNIIVNEYPDSNKVGPSMLKIGFAYQILGDLNKANQQLRKVQQNFPDSSISQLASVRLQEITQQQTNSS